MITPNILMSVPLDLPRLLVTCRYYVYMWIECVPVDVVCTWVPF